MHYGDHTDVIDRSGPTPVTSTYRWQTVQGLIRPSSVTAPCPQCGSSQATTSYAATGEVAQHSLGRETQRAVLGVTYKTATSRPVGLRRVGRTTEMPWPAAL